MVRILWIVYSNSFSDGLESLIYNWKVELEFTSEKIKIFVQSIETSLRMVTEFPEMHEEVSDLYELSSPTYRILMGKEYACFIV